MGPKKKKIVTFDDAVEASFNEHNFIQACDMNNFIVINKYIKQGLDVNCHLGDFTTCLHIAADHDYCGLLKLLLNVPKININARNLWGCTPLFHACSRNHIKALQILLQYKANVNIPNKFGSTPLHNAVLMRHDDIVTLLLKHHAKVDAENIFGKTPLYHAVVDSPNEMIVNLLVTYGADVNFNNIDTMPILLEAALSCQSIVELRSLIHFIELDCNINIRDLQSGRNVLHIAAMSDFVPLADYLVSVGVEMHVRDFRNRSPLDIAIKQENKAMIQFFKFSMLLEDENITLSSEKSSLESLIV